MTMATNTPLEPTQPVGMLATLKTSIEPSGVNSVICGMSMIQATKEMRPAAMRSEIFSCSAKL